MYVHYIYLLVQVNIEGLDSCPDHTLSPRKGSGDYYVYLGCVLSANIFIIM